MVTTNKDTMQKDKVILVVGIVTWAFNQYHNCNIALKNRFAFTKDIINMKSRKLV